MCSVQGAVYRVRVQGAVCSVQLHVHVRHDAELAIAVLHLTKSGQNFPNFRIKILNSGQNVIHFPINFLVKINVIASTADAIYGACDSD